jgi:methane/ammonia monooxygenase subunit B
MNTKKIIKLCVIGSLGMATLGLTLVFNASPAAAHGERSQEPFLRMRTAQWYDTRWNPQKTAVNDEAILSGKMHIAEDWPRAVVKPNRTFINVGSPSSVFTRLSSKVNGTPMFTSGPMEIGGDYEYVIKLRARLPGHHHIHPMLAVNGAGPIAGPGGWMDITGNYQDFTNPVKLLVGGTINTETAGLAAGYFWHILWMSIGLCWIGWFGIRPMFLIRARVLAQEGGDALLNDPVDRIVAYAVIGVTLLIVAIGFYTTDASYPYTVPLQAGEAKIKATHLKSDLTVKVLNADYDVPGRALRLTLQVTNGGESAVRIGEFTTAGIRFLNTVGAANNLDPDYPKEIMAVAGLNIENESPINPGETREIKIDSRDSLWEVQRLMDLVHDPEQRFGGLLMAWDEAGNRHINSIAGPIIPVFTRAQG